MVRPVHSFRHVRHVTATVEMVYTSRLFDRTVTHTHHQLHEVIERKSNLAVYSRQNVQCRNEFVSVCTEYAVRRSPADCDEFVVRRRQLCRNVHQVPDRQEPAEGFFGNSQVHRHAVQNPKRKRTTGKTFTLRYAR